MSVVSSVVDRVKTGEKWEFNADVTAAFDDMLQRSIPQYDLMRKSVFDVGCGFQKNSTDVLDLGASRGEAIAPFVTKYGAYNKYVMVEVSPPMLEVLRSRFKGMIDCSQARVLDLDLRTKYPPVSACVTLCVLTLQFIPIEHRQKVVRNTWKHCTAGGCVILVEKVIGSTAELDEAISAEYRRMKLTNGYSQDDVDRKALSLEGVLVPVTADWNEGLLRAAGFRHVECFWRWMNFAGWLAIKE